MPRKLAYGAWIVRLVDSDPKRGGVTEVVRYGTYQEAIWYAKREVEAAKELGFKAPITWTIRS